MNDINAERYMITRTLKEMHPRTNKGNAGTQKRPAETDTAAHDEELRSVAESITQRSAILIKADLRRINAAATLEDAKREKEIAQAICAADNPKQLRAALNDMRQFMFNIRARARVMKH